jgi:hypothetical protein
LSVFTGIVLKALRTCRVSKSSTVKPASAMAARSRWVRGPASSPIRSIGTPSSSNEAISASGSLSTFPRRPIRPSASVAPPTRFALGDLVLGVGRVERGDHVGRHLLHDRADLFAGVLLHGAEIPAADPREHWSLELVQLSAGTL